MLLGGITFAMALFYLVHNRDQDIRVHTWGILSSTIAIFASVFSYQALDGVLTHLVEDLIEGHSSLEFVASTTSFVQFIALFFAMQVLIGHVANEDPPLDAHERGEWVHEHECKVKAWSELLAHVVGFAALDFISDTQDLAFFRQNTALALVPVAVLAGLLFVFFRMADYMRHQVANKEDSDDDVLSSPTHHHTIWDHEAEEAENEVAAFALSFVLVRVVRRWIIGHSERDGSEVMNCADLMRPLGWLLCAVLLFCLAMHVLTMSLFGHRKHKVKHHTFVGLDPIMVYMKRWSFILFQTCGMGFAWCCLFAAQWGTMALFRSQDMVLSVHSPILTSNIALLTSLFAFACIFVLDRAADELRSERIPAEKALRVIMGSLGILIGFAWEQAFHTGTTVLASSASRGYSKYLAHAIETLIGSAILMVIVPAWRWYILTHTLHLQGEYEMARDASKSMSVKLGSGH